MPHLIFQIDEILRPIAEYVGQVSRSTAVEFARCCKAFEEPALRPLWENTTLGNLMHVLPMDVLCFGSPGICAVGLFSRSLNRLDANAWTRFSVSSASSLQPNAEGYSDMRLGSDESRDS